MPELTPSAVPAHKQAATNGLGNGEHSKDRADTPPRSRDDAASFSKETRTDIRMQESQHLSQSSPVILKTLCKDVKPGESLYIHKDGTGGVHDEDFVGVFTL